MPTGTHKIELDIPIERVWMFVSDMDNWAPLVSGYVEHKKVNEKQSTWKFKGDIGIAQKTVHLKIDITEWQEPTKVTFDLTGLNERFTGNGYFQANALNEMRTNVTSHLNVTARGIKGPIINTILKTLLPKTTTDLTQAIAEKMRRLETAAT